MEKCDITSAMCNSMVVQGNIARALHRTTKESAKRHYQGGNGRHWLTIELTPRFPHRNPRIAITKAETEYISYQGEQTPRFPQRNP